MPNQRDRDHAASKQQPQHETLRGILIIELPLHHIRAAGGRTALRKNKSNTLPI
jgi:hypothetical protein